METKKPNDYLADIKRISKQYGSRAADKYCRHYLGMGLTNYFLLVLDEVTDDMIQSARSTNSGLEGMIGRTMVLTAQLEFFNRDKRLDS